MKRAGQAVVGGVILAAVAGLAWFTKEHWLHKHVPAPSVHTVQRGTFELWTPLQGHVEANEVLQVRSPLEGAATVLWIAADESPVTKGEVLLRFDPSVFDEKLIAQERDLRLAQAEWRSLVKGTQPLALQKLQADFSALQAKLDAQQSLEDDTRELVEDKLLSERELRTQEAATNRLKEQLTALKAQRGLLTEHIHPAARERAEARLDAAKRAVARTRKLKDGCVVTSPADGVVQLREVPIGNGELRGLRVGDVVYQNQILLDVADFTTLVIRTQVRETDLSRVQAGMKARLRFPAYPRLEMTASVDTVAVSMDKATRSFLTSLRLTDVDPRLRPGMRCHIQVRSHRQENVVLLPRELVPGIENPTVRIIEADGTARRQHLELGDANTRYVIVENGLQGGERVLTE